MTAEQLLEQMEIFEKAKNDFIEFEQSHQSAFKDFLKQFGFNDAEIKSIITGDNINKLKLEEPKNGEISARNEIITLFSLYNEISIAQTEKIRQINVNAEASAEDELKTMHFENLARTINQIPMDYYRKVHFGDPDKNQTSDTPQTEQAISSQQNQQSINIQIKPNSQETQQSQQQQKNPLKIEPKQGKSLTITSKSSQTNSSSSGKQLNIQISKNQNTPQKNQNTPQKNQNTPQKSQNAYQKNQNQGYPKKNNPQQNQNQGNKPKYPPNQPKYTPPQNQSQPKYTPPPSQPRYTPPPPQQQKPNTNIPLRVEKPNIQISTNNAHKVEKPTGGGKVSIQLSKKNTGSSLFDKK